MITSPNVRNPPRELDAFDETRVILDVRAEVAREP